jgi:hypothetical protein
LQRETGRVLRGGGEVWWWRWRWRWRWRRDGWIEFGAFFVLD